MRRSVSRITRQARSTSTTRTVDPRRSSGVGAIGLGGVKGTRLVPGSRRHLHRLTNSLRTPEHDTWRSISVAMASPARSKHRRRRPSGLVEASELNGSTPKKPVNERRPPPETQVPNPAGLVHELGSCVTEADIVQVLY